MRPGRGFLDSPPLFHARSGAAPDHAEPLVDFFLPCAPRTIFSFPGFTFRQSVFVQASDPSDARRARSGTLCSFATRLKYAPPPPQARGHRLSSGRAASRSAGPRVHYWTLGHCFSPFPEHSVSRGWLTQRSRRISAPGPRSPATSRSPMASFPAASTPWLESTRSIHPLSQVLAHIVRGTAPARNQEHWPRPILGRPQYERKKPSPRASRHPEAAP